MDRDAYGPDSTVERGPVQTAERHASEHQVSCTWVIGLRLPSRTSVDALTWPRKTLRLPGGAPPPPRPPRKAPSARPLALL
eukprot:5434304-Alexandrium_andersonii.AAC.1